MIKISKRHTSSQKKHGGLWRQGQEAESPPDGTSVRARGHSHPPGRDLPHHRQEGSAPQCHSLLCRRCGQGPAPSPSTALTPLGKRAPSRSQKTRDGTERPGAHGVESPEHLLSSAGRGDRLTPAGFVGIKPITEAPGAYPTPFLRPPFSTCFQILGKTKGNLQSPG